MPLNRTALGATSLLGALWLAALVTLPTSLLADSYRVRNLLEVAEESDHWVHFEIDDLRTLPADGMRIIYVDDFEKVVLQLTVRRAFPELSQESIRLEGHFFRTDSTKFRKGGEWIVGLRTRRMMDGTLKYEPLRELYRIDARKKTVELRSPRAKLPLEETWRLCVDLKRVVGSDYSADAPTLAFWQEKLAGKKAAVGVLAAEFFGSLVSPPPVAEQLLAGLRRHGRKSNRSQFAGPAITVLEQVADTAAAESLLEYYLHRLTSGRVYQSFPVRGIPRVLARAGKARRRLLEKFLKRNRTAPIPNHAYSAIPQAYEDLSVIPGKDIDQLLHHAYRIELAGPADKKRHLRSVVNALARRGSARIRKDLADYFKNGSRSKLARAGLDEEAAEWAWEAFLRSVSRSDRVAAYAKRLEEGDTRVLQKLHHSLTPAAKHLVPLLSKLTVKQIRDDYSLDSFAGDVVDYFPDAAFLPLLRQIVTVQPSGRAFEALSTCGDPKLAKIEALKVFRSPEYRHKRRDVTLFLGSTGNRKLLPELEHLARKYAMDEDYRLADVATAAVLAIARIGGPHAVERLKDLYQHPSMRLRTVAAMGLHYHQEETGSEFIELIREHNELAHPEILARWNYDFVHGNSFAAMVRYLRAPHMDTLLLERLRVRHDRMDSALEFDQAFITQYRDMILPQCVEYLTSPYSDIRRHAYWLLQRYTMKDIPFNHSDPPAKRRQAQKRWVEFIERF